MNNTIIVEALEELARNYKNGIEVVPHIISVETNVVHTTAEITYQMEIPLLDVADGFLLIGIHSRYEIQHLRIRKRDKVYFSSPGWFVYAYHDHRLDPALLMAGPKDSGGWFMDVAYKPRFDQSFFEPEKLMFALIGQRVVSL